MASLLEASVGRICIGGPSFSLMGVWVGGVLGMEDILSCFALGGNSLLFLDCAGGRCSLCLALKNGSVVK